MKEILTDTEILDGLLALIDTVGTDGLNAIVTHEKKRINRESLTPIVQKDWLAWWMGFLAGKKAVGK